MDNFDNSRIFNLAYYILEHHTTIRATASAFGMAKSTVHHDLSTKLKHINKPLYLEVKKLLDENFNNKHIHGGESTKLKYQKLRENINVNDEIEAIIL